MRRLGWTAARNMKKQTRVGVADVLRTDARKTVFTAHQIGVLARLD
jgi:hypothetical protein